MAQCAQPAPQEERPHFLSRISTRMIPVTIAARIASTTMVPMLFISQLISHLSALKSSALPYFCTFTSSAVRFVASSYFLKNSM